MQMPDAPSFDNLPKPNGEGISNRHEGYTLKAIAMPTVRSAPQHSRDLDKRAVRRRHGRFALGRIAMSYCRNIPMSTPWWRSRTLWLRRCDQRPGAAVPIRTLQNLAQPNFGGEV
jgi:galactarate dehydratase